jgi:hypothetical protein
METLQTWITTWLDPRVVGTALRDWGGRILGALVIFIIGRMLIRGLTTWATVGMRRVGMDDTLSRYGLSIPAVHRAVPPPQLIASK